MRCCCKLFLQATSKKYFLLTVLIHFTDITAGTWLVENMHGGIAFSHKPRMIFIPFMYLSEIFWRSYVLIIPVSWVWRIANWTYVLKVSQLKGLF